MGSAAAQLTGTDTQAFVDAAQKRDGAKATQLLASHPTIVDTKDANGDTGLIIALRASDQAYRGFLLNKGAIEHVEAKWRHPLDHGG